jgi:hypothetical protein
MDRSDAPAIAAARGVTGPEGMSGILRSVQSGPIRQLLDNPRHIDTAQPAWLYMPVAIYGTEHRPAADARHFQPRLNRADGSSLGIGPVRNAHLTPGALLIHLGHEVKASGK